jgi:hypothetical protein
MFPTFGPDASGAAFDATKMTVAAGLYPQSPGGSGNGAGVDFNNGTGSCFAIQLIGAVTADTISGKIQESTDNSAWTDVSGGAFTAVTTANNLQTINFTRTKRYLRYSYSLSSIGDYIACAIAQANQ